MYFPTLFTIRKIWKKPKLIVKRYGKYSRK
jgi:hypothetical protein